MTEQGEGGTPPGPSLPTPESFPFPYPKPYDIQLQLMQTVFRAIEDGRIAIVESPTGTGKSLSLLTSTLTWLSAHTRRQTHSFEDALRAQLRADDHDDPEWVIEHSVKARLGELRSIQEAKNERLRRAREKERKIRQGNVKGAFRSLAGAQKKKLKVEQGKDDKTQRGDREAEEEYLPDDKDQDQGEDQDGPYLSKEVRELMSKYEASRPKAHQDEEEEEDAPKIYYTSRTHTQLRQLTSELLKTSFPVDRSLDILNQDPSSHEVGSTGVSLVPLGSRKQLCISDKVRALAKGSGGDERMNEACLDMQKSGKPRCQYLPAKGEEGAMLDARDAILASVKDIEDIVTSGKELHVCPYYSTRRAVKQSQIVTLPYNLLLQKNAREALDIKLKDQVVVIDEAHNLIDTLLSIHSTSLTSLHLSTAISQLTQYLARFKNRLAPLHAIWIKQVLSVLQGLLRVCLCFKETYKGTGEILDVNTLMEQVGGGNDQVNPMELVKYLKESKLARKISGFSEHLAEQAQAKEPKTARSASARHASIAAFHVVETFLLSLVDAKDDGRVLLSLDELPSGSTVVTIKYVLLNPAERFREVVEQARSVVLAGGTMEPISDFLQQLFPTIPRDRFATLSCSHVIPKENLLTQVVRVGPRKTEFEFKYSNRDNENLLTELGAVIQSTIGLVPDGVVIFVPSYAFLDKVKAFWTKSGLLTKLGDKKELFFEPQTSGDADSIVRDYALSISSCQAALTSGEKSKKTGALLFAVVGGKLSEGINFSDSLGRCVIMVGLPFANVGSIELQERMRYVEGLPGNGPEASREMYENLCMRAVNQSIGRAIRHANDYATILLVDKRYASPRIKNKLPKWIGEDVKIQQDFTSVARGLAGFFREKREKANRGRE
ncbi:chromosome transmission fidelity protein 1 [Kwoniella heveanensis CBS 569]|nr:chromosome transmission fidelity protein 1 [Kwoniella heveanensis CBS 569]